MTRGGVPEAEGSATRAASADRRWLSPAALVAIRGNHLCVVGVDDQPDLPLDLPALELMSVLAGDGPPSLAEARGEVVARTGGSAERLSVLAADLASRRLLLAQPPPVRRRSVPSAGTPSEAGPGPVTSDEPLVLDTPVVLRTLPGGFEHLTHEARRSVLLEPIELMAASEFRRPVTSEQALAHHRTATGPAALDPIRFAALVTRLARAGLLSPFDEQSADSRENIEARTILGFIRRMRMAVRQTVKDHEALEHQREQATGSSRIPVMPIDLRGNPTSLGLGMIVAHAKAHGGPVVDDHYQFVPNWFMLPDELGSLPDTPSVFLFSNYIWSHGQNLAASETLKRRLPSSLIIHGGPDTPKYEGDVEAYFAANPHVDVAVHGEGEVTTTELLEALAHSFGDHEPDLSNLHDVAGLTFRHRGRVVTTATRDRIVDVDTIPSPYLMGLFDAHARAGGSFAILETNRGCPYGCTFCDWGSATASRIRKFDLGRVFAELDWCAQHEIDQVFLADANFGIFERDVEIAEMVADLRQRHGFPKLFSTNYAKNTTKHLRKIVQTLRSAEILTQGLLSLQSMDEETLSTVKRSNIKLEKYEDLAREFRTAGLPLFVDLMIGLPGATPLSFRDDLQGCVDREVTAKIYPTELLVNSPMNAPDYRTENLIETSAPLGSLVKSSRNADGSTRRALLVSTSSYTRADYDEMLQMRRAFIVAENLGVLRQVARYVRQESDLREVDLYDRLRAVARAEPERWPSMAFTFEAVPFVGAPPVSWALLIDEVRDYLTFELGLIDDPSLDTVLRVQHALMPARDRTFPVHLELPHDFGTWHRALLAAKDTGDYDWTGRVPHLRELPPSTFTIDDPNDVCGRGIGFSIDENAHAAWELGSSVARAVSNEHLVAS
ncbi:MAG: radical SAM protein [Acidimicrobiales bacterium]